MNNRLLLLVVGVLLLALAACGGNGEKNGNSSNETNGQSGEEATIEGGTITVASSSEPGNLNTVIWPTTSDTYVTDMIFDSLVIPDDELKMVGSLAKDWEISEDGKTYTFFLEEGVTWHDGEPFTANDIEFTFTALADPEYDMGFYWRVDPILGADAYHNGEADTVEGIEVIDEHTIKFTTEEPFAPFLSGLFVGVLPQHILGGISPSEWDKHDSNRNPIGTGPFKFEEWKTGQYVKVSKNENYFKGAPNLDTIFVRFGDANSMLASFMSEEIDIAPVPVAEVESIETLDFSQLTTQSALSVFYVGFNGLNSHFEEKLVRQALAHAVNKEAIVESVLGEFGIVSDDVYPSEHWSHNPDVPTYEYDLEKTASLLEEAGYEKNSDGVFEKDGNLLSFTLEVPTGNKERETTAALLKQMWDEAGAKVELQSQDFPTLITKLLPEADDGTQREVTTEDFDAYILGFGVEADPDEYRSYFGSSYMPPKGYNFVSYSNPKVDELMERQTKEIELEQRQKTIWEIGYELAADEIWIPLYEQENPYVYNNRLIGFDPDFRGVTFGAKDWAVTE